MLTIKAAILLVILHVLLIRVPTPAGMPPWVHLIMAALIVLALLLLRL
jgi:hypothetical protein